MSDQSLFAAARKGFHAALIDSGTLRITTRAEAKGNLPMQHPSNADGDSSASIAIAQAIYDQIESEVRPGARLAGQRSGKKFELITRSFVEQTFAALSHLRPGKWDTSPVTREIWLCEQYSHLSELAALAETYEELKVHLGHKSDYVITPDILLVRYPEPDELINAKENLVDTEIAQRSSLRECYNPLPILHASISCKWTLRSDRAQNSRSEALNLIRNRKGRVPHIAVVTGEPLPSRLASLALGTGDLDCVYHFALPELIAGVSNLGPGAEESISMVKIMTDGKRLKDISDLPLDLAV